MADLQSKIIVTAEDRTAAAFASIGKSFGSIQNALAGLSGFVVSAFSVDALISFGAAMTEAARQAEQSESRLVAVLRATDNAAGFTKKQLDELAESMARSTQFDDESIRQAEAELLKFGNIQGAVFTNALKLSADVAAFMGNDIPSAAAQLGKSLEDPEAAFGLLRKAGIVLTDTQKDLIKSFQDAGNTAEAQRVILEKLASAFGGTAAEMNSGITKATKDLSKEWNDLLEALGRTQNVQGGLVQVSGVITSLLRNVRELVEENRKASLIRIGIEKPENRKLPTSDFGKPIEPGNFSDLPKTGNVIPIEFTERKEALALIERAKLIKKLDAQNKKDGEERLKQEMDIRGKIGEVMTREEEQDAARQEQQAVARQAAFDQEVEQLSKSLLAKTDLINAQYATDLQTLYDARQAEYLTETQFKEAREQLELDHQAKLGNIAAQAELARRDFSKMTFDQQLATASKGFALLANLMQSKHKAMFEIGKVGAIAQSAIATRTGAIEAYKALAGIPVVGPALGAAAAIAVTAFGLEQISAINSTSFGGASAGGATPTVGVNPNTGIPTGTSGGDVGSMTDVKSQTAIQVIVQGNVYGNQDFAQYMTEVIRDAVNNRDLVIINGDSRQAIELRA